MKGMSSKFFKSTILIKLVKNLLVIDWMIWGYGEWGFLIIGNYYRFKDFIDLS